MLGWAQRDRALSTQRIRGLLLGLALGESYEQEPAPVLQAGTGAQLACFTVEGMIRASRRLALHDLCHPPTVIWHALCRWSFERGFNCEVIEEGWRTGDIASGFEWPGWLMKIPQVTRDVGTSPTTVDALADGEMGTPDRPRNSSDSYQALLRVIPLAYWSPSMPVEEFDGLLTEVLALTHGAGSMSEPATEVIHVLGGLLRNPVQPDVFDLRQAMSWIAPDPHHTLGDLIRLVQDTPPGRPDVLQEFARDATVRSVVLGGLYAAASHPSPGQAMESLSFCRFEASQSKAVAAVTGALIGATFGPTVFDQSALARLELNWVVDSLAYDIVSERFDLPSKHAPASGPDPIWSSRYPPN